MVTCTGQRKTASAETQSKVAERLLSFSDKYPCFHLRNQGCGLRVYLTPQQWRTRARERQNSSHLPFSPPVGIPGGHCHHTELPGRDYHLGLDNDYGF